MISGIDNQEGVKKMYKLELLKVYAKNYDVFWKGKKVGYCDGDGFGWQIRIINENKRQRDNNVKKFSEARRFLKREDTIAFMNGDNQEE